VAVLILGVAPDPLTEGASDPRALGPRPHHAEREQSCEREPAPPTEDIGDHGRRRPEGRGDREEGSGGEDRWNRNNAAPKTEQSAPVVTPGGHHPTRAWHPRITDPQVLDDRRTIAIAPATDPPQVDLHETAAAHPTDLHEPPVGSQSPMLRSEPAGSSTGDEFDQFQDRDR
jgi:hypothetical protein